MCNQKAKESILCDEKTYSLCENEFVFNNLGTIKVKGKTAPISIYQPKFLRENFSKALTVSIENDIFVGRDKERAIIEETLKTHLITIGPRILIVEGDGGMGLSTLATWTCVRAEELNISVVYVFLTLGLETQQRQSEHQDITFGEILLQIC